MKSVELKLISELMKNSRQSDRDLAKTIGVSQPTVTRIRNKLEKEGYIREYTLIPDFPKLGYKILAITFARVRSTLGAEEIEKLRKTARETFQKTAPLEILFSGRGMGLGYQGIFVSLHEDYASYLKFRDWVNQFSASASNILDASSVEGFLISLDETGHYRSMTFATVAKHLLRMKEKKE
jgi:DNA-binding Lrp family transcriptional regulator